MKNVKRNIFLGLSTFVVCIILFCHFDTVQNSFKIFIKLDRTIEEESKTFHRKIIPACNIPVLNPFHADALDVWRSGTKEGCDIKKISAIEGDTLVVDDLFGDIKSVYVEYIIRGRIRKADGSLNPPLWMNETGMQMDKLYSYDGVVNEDFHVHFSQPISIYRNSKKKQFILKSLKKDFFRVTIIKRENPHTRIHEYHYQISDTQNICDKHGRKLSGMKKGLKYNINLIMLDAQSRGNMHRQTRKLMSILENDENALLFNAHGINGDGTTCQAMAILAGSLVFYSR